MAAAKKPTHRVDCITKIAHIDTVIDHLTNMRADTVSSIEPELLAPFWDEVHAIGAQELKSVNGEDADATGLISFKRKTKAQPLKPADTTMLREAKITMPAPPAGKHAVTLSYFADSKFVDKFVGWMDTLAAQGVEIPDDFIVPADPKIIVDDSLVLSVMSRDFQTACKLLPAIGSVSVSKAVLRKPVNIQKSIAAVAAETKRLLAEEREEAAQAA